MEENLPVGKGNRPRGRPKGSGKFVRRFVFYANEKDLERLKIAENEMGYNFTATIRALLYEYVKRRY